MYKNRLFRHRMFRVKFLLSHDCFPREHFITNTRKRQGIALELNEIEKFLPHISYFSYILTLQRFDTMPFNKTETCIMDHVCTDEQVNYDMRKLTIA